MLSPSIGAHAYATCAHLHPSQQATDILRTEGESGKNMLPTKYGFFFQLAIDEQQTDNYASAKLPITMDM